MFPSAAGIRDPSSPVEDKLLTEIQTFLGEIIKVVVNFTKLIIGNWAELSDPEGLNTLACFIL